MTSGAAVGLFVAIWLTALGIAYLPLLTPPNRRPSLAEAGVALAIGTAATGVVLVLLRAVDATNRDARAVLIALFFAQALIVMWRRRRTLIPSPVGRNVEERVCIAAILLLWLSPQLVGAVLMGTGPFPQAFFNVDTAFRMTHVHEMLRESGFPPSSLTNLGGRPANHVGAPGVAAALSIVSGLSPHAALFAVALPVAAIGVFCAMFLLAQTITRTRPWWCVVLVFVYLLTAWPWPSFEFVRTVFDAVTGERQWEGVQEFGVRFIEDRQSFNNYFEDVTHLFGRALLLVAVRPLLSPDDNPRDAWAAALAVTLLGQIKAGPGMLAALLFGVAGAASLVRTRHVTAAVLPIVAAVGALALMRLAGIDAIVELTIEPFWMVRHYPSQVWRDLLNAGILVLLPIAPIVMRWRWPFQRSRPGPAVQVLVAICLTYVTYNVVGAYWDGGGWVLPPRRLPFEPFLHPVTYMPTLFAAASMLVLMRAWPDLPLRQRRWSAAVVLILGVPALLHRAEGAVLMGTAPERAHEYADNRPIAPALSAIPRNGVIATNDLRYPAEQYSRDLRQFQIPAVFGHQAYAVPGYERYPGWQERVAVQRRVREGDLTCDVWRTLYRDGVTHLLIHRRATASTRIPLHPLYADAAYAVYAVDQAVAWCARRSG